MALTNNEQMIRDAFEAQVPLEFDYQGFHRLGCGHSVGMKRGLLHVLIYQFGGASAKPLGGSGSELNWRCMEVERMSNVHVIGGIWHTASDHSRPQNCVD